MRATLSGYYRNLQFDQTKTAKALFDVTKQISSGQKIQYAHEDTTTFVNTVRLDNELTTLVQVKDNAANALQVSRNTDSTMNEMTKILDTIKVKLVAASNETNSRESRDAIAAELRGLEQNLLQLANTSINGNYIFSGSDIKTKPIDVNGAYQGNAQDLTAFIGSGVKQTYNINGQDLFLGSENDTQRKITLNVPLLNQTKLYPDIMVDSSLPRLEEEEYITGSHSIRDLMGDTDTLINNIDAQHHFYVQGRNHDGVTFKETISMRDDESVDGLMARIGAAFGNLPNSQLVTVNVNHDGQIEIEDNRPGSSELDFHMTANTDITGPVTDLENLNSNQTSVKSFMKSDYTEFISNVGQRQDKYDTNIFELSADFLTKDGQKANSATLLSEVLRADVASITFGGVDSTTPAPGVAVAPAFYNVTATSTMQDLLNAIDTAYDANGVGSGDINVSMKEGKIVIARADLSAPDLDIQLEAHNVVAGVLGNAGTTVNGLPSDASVAFDEAEFEKEANRLIGNVSQIVRADNEYAKLDTRLFEVASGTDLNGQVFSLEGIDINGVAFQASINLNTAGSTFTYNGAGPYAIFNTGGTSAATPIAISAGNPQAPVAANDMTYKQLSDVVNMVLTGNVPASLANVNGATGSADDYNAAVDNSQTLSVTSLDEEGRLVFSEHSATLTQASFKLSDVNASDFTANSSVLSFQSNKALEISDPKTNFFKQIDAIISSVEEGRIRADGTLGDPRNIGIQNSIQVLDDLANHLYNQHSVAGVQSQTLQTTEDRTDMLIITTKTLRSQTLDVDIAEATLELQQLQLNYQAMLSTVSRMSQLSLVNYL